MTSHMEQPNVLAHRVLSLLHLPHELLILIFKAQTSFRDVSRLSQACSLLYTISHSNAHAIAKAIDQQPSIPVQEAIDLADLQLLSDIYKDDDPRRKYAHNVSLAARAIANSTSLRLLSYCYNEAFRLAEPELFLASSDAAHYNPTPSMLARRCLLESPAATAGFDAHIAGGIDYFGLRYRIFTNMQESVCALVMAATYFIPHTRRLNSKCTIHPLDALLPHEIARFFGAWYWFKLYVLSYHNRGDGLRQTLAAELKSMNFVQVTVYLGIIQFLINDLEREQAEKLGIMEMTKDLTNVNYIAYDWYEAQYEWADLRDNITARHRELETLGIDLQPTIERCFNNTGGEIAIREIRDEAERDAWDENLSLGGNQCNNWFDIVIDGCDTSTTTSKPGCSIGFAAIAILRIESLVMRRLWDRGKVSTRRCNGIDNNYYLTQSTLASNIEDYYSASAAQSLVNSGTAFSKDYNAGTPDHVRLTTQWATGPLSYQVFQEECTYYMSVVTNGCDVPSGSINPLDWKHGGSIADNNEVTYTITPDVERAPPPNMALGHCESKYKFLWATFDVYSGGWADSDYGGSPGGLLAQLRGCGAVTNWNFEYYDTPAKDGTERHAWGRLPIGTKGCVGRAVTSSGGFGGGCGGSG